MHPDRAGMSAYERVAEQIKQDIRIGSLAPGAKLLGNRRLADYFEVALGTVQKAVHLLQDQGWVVATPAVGVFVADRQPEEAPGTTIEEIREELRLLQARTADLSIRLERLEVDRSR